LNFSTDFRKIDVGFHENPSREIRVVPCGQTEVQTDVTKLIVAFRNLASERKERAWLGRSPSFLRVYRWFSLLRILKLFFCTETCMKIMLYRISQYN